MIFANYEKQIISGSPAPLKSREKVRKKMYFTVNGIYPGFDDDILRDIDGDIITDQAEAIDEIINNHIGFEEYDEWIDEIDGSLTVLGAEYNASYILKRLSPGDYQIGYADFKEWLRDRADHDLDRFGECYIWHIELVKHEEDENDED